MSWREGGRERTRERERERERERGEREEREKSVSVILSYIVLYMYMHMYMYMCVCLVCVDILGNNVHNGAAHKPRCSTAHGAEDIRRLLWGRKSVYLGESASLFGSICV